jgi:DNA-binding response OmpR family regulator
VLSIDKINSQPINIQVLTNHLSIQKYQVETASNGMETLEKIKQNTYDLILLDIMMPKMDGFTFTENIRQKGAGVPVIFLTAKSMKEDKIKGFKIGGDDYITKPFSMEELEVRVEAVLRRTSASGKDKKDKYLFLIGAYSFDYPSQLLEHQGQKVRLTTKEAELLKQLCLHMNDILEREMALKLIWGNDNYFTGRSMDVFITKLRKYLKADDRVEIVNVHGTGYKLMVDTK